MLPRQPVLGTLLSPDWVFTKGRMMARDLEKEWEVWDEEAESWVAAPQLKLVKGAVKKDEI